MSDQIHFANSRAKNKNILNNILSSSQKENITDSLTSFEENSAMKNNSPKSIYKNLSENKSLKENDKNTDADVSKNSKKSKKKDYIAISNELKKLETKMRKLKLNNRRVFLMENNFRFDYNPITNLNSLENVNPANLEIETGDSQEVTELNNKGFDCDNIAKIFEVIQNVQILPKKRSLNNLLMIVKYLISTSIGKYFHEEFENKAIYEKLITFCGTEMKYKLFKKGEIIFKIGDLPDYFYIILYGKVDILKPISKKVNLSGYDFFCRLMNLKKQKEDYLINLTIKENRNEFFIKKDEFDKLPYIFLLKNLDEIQKDNNVNLLEVLNLANISFEELNIDPTKANNKNYIIDHIKQIKKILKNITSSLLIRYSFVNDKLTKNEITLFEYEKFLSLETKQHFGDSAMDSNSCRNATIVADEDTHVGYIPNSLYNNNVVAEKLVIIEKKVNFLYSNFYFSKINKKKFEKHYFSYFIYDQYHKGEIIFSENKTSDYVYFIEEGTCELYSEKNILEIEKILESLETKIKKLISDKNEDESNMMFGRVYDRVANEESELINEIKLKERKKIFTIQNNEDLGLLSFYFGFPYLTNCVVNSNIVKLYKIEFKYLSEIFLKEKECYMDLVKKVEYKLKIFHDRFFKINNTKIVFADKKITDDKRKIEKSFSCLDIFHNRINNLTKNNNKFNKSSVKYEKIKEILNKCDNSKNEKNDFPLICSQKNLIFINKNENNIFPIQRYKENNIETKKIKNKTLIKKFQINNLKKNKSENRIMKKLISNRKNIEKNYISYNENKLREDNSITSEFKPTNYSIFNNFSMTGSIFLSQSYNNFQNDVNSFRYNSFYITNDYYKKNSLIGLKKENCNIGKKKMIENNRNKININSISLDRDIVNKKKNRAYISPLVLSKKEKYNIDMSEKLFIQNEKNLRDKLKESYKLKGLNEYGFPLNYKNFHKKAIFKSNRIIGKTINFNNIKQYIAKRNIYEK